ncbi:hypothetical protein GC088_14060 [Arthrobacter sp. JZ12]|uniref:hypothetical protein n=1 Tax=Arthrobacter sp. JZ12 TaxID=2654190 RepID=UPI002B463763|nr:hypothetical protein [Arthrobacter sp. JZ12]WRH26080.1 hypothetical protein GC088_14060 [Arthrobacter sp. JZ12]
MSTQNWSEDPLVSSTPSAGNYPSEGQSTASTAKDEAKDVGREGLGAAKNVAQTAGSEAKNVAQEAGTQAKNLVGQLGSDIKSQAGTQQQRVTNGLRSISDELNSMAQSSEGGPAQQLVQQVAQRAGSAASWLEGRDPGSLLDEVTGFARRRPGAFLLIAAGAGLLAGRLTRGLAGGSDSSGSPSTGGGMGTTGGGQHVATYPPVPDEYGTDLPAYQTGAPGYGAGVETPPVAPPTTTPTVNPTTPFAQPGVPDTETGRDFR